MKLSLAGDRAVFISAGPGGIDSIYQMTNDMGP